MSEFSIISFSMSPIFSLYILKSLSIEINVNLDGIEYNDNLNWDLLDNELIPEKFSENTVKDENLPEKFKELYTYIKKLEFEQDPDYDYCRKLLIDVIENNCGEN